MSLVDIDMKKLAEEVKKIAKREPDKTTTFRFTEREEERFQKWNEEHKKTCWYVQNNKDITKPLIPRLTYTFTPTGIGDMITVKCKCGVWIDVSDGTEW